jgi:Fur family transcriptional regulator, ferric uptake regulator
MTPPPGSATPSGTAEPLTGTLLAALGRAGVRVTGPRRAVARLVVAREGHFTAAELLEDARRDPDGIGRATVFRCLELFTALGLVERVDLPDGTHAWVACDDIHHHHAICTGCGRSVDVDDHGLAETLETMGRRTGFRVTSHRLEVFGTCAACSAAAGGA